MKDGVVSSRLAALLDAAAGPPLTAERAGEDRAVAAYRAARIDARRRRNKAQTPALPWARAGAWIAAVAVAGTAGAALAAGVQAPKQTSQSTEGTGPAPAAAPHPQTATPQLAPAPSHAPAATVSGRPDLAVLKGYCTAYFASGGQPGKALSSPALRELAAAAGGADRVGAYCEGLVPRVKAVPTRPNPAGDGRPRATPTNRPSVPA